MSVMQKARCTSRDLTPLIATEVRADVDTLLSGEIAADIRDILENRGVVVFPEVNLTDEQQVAFTKTVGTYAAEQGVFKVTLDVKENDYADYLRSGFFWHLDGTMDKTPLRASLLSARRVSPVGGQTESANTYAAYEALSEEDKRLIAGLKARHTLEALHSSVYPEPAMHNCLNGASTPAGHCRLSGITNRAESRWSSACPPASSTIWIGTRAACCSPGCVTMRRSLSSSIGTSGSRETW